MADLLVGRRHRSAFNNSLAINTPQCFTESALGSDPFAISTPFTNAVLLDAFFAVLSVTGLTLASVIAEREQAQREREQGVREQGALEARHEAEQVVRASEERLRLAQQAARI